MARKLKIQNLTWRQVGTGQHEQHLARWNPGPKLRSYGFRAVDLWAGPGTPLTAESWSKAGFVVAPAVSIAEKITPARLNVAMAPDQARKAATALNKAVREQIDGLASARPAEPATAAPHPLTLNALFDDFLDAKRGQIAPKTYETYCSALNYSRRWIGDDPPCVLDKAMLEDFFGRLKTGRGHHTAHKALSTLQTALGWAHGRAPWVGPIMPEMATYKSLGLPAPRGRLRVALPEETDALFLAMEDPGRIYDALDTPAGERILTPKPSMADALVTLLWTCLRVGDALTLKDEHITDQLVADQTMIVYRPAKNNHGDRHKVVTIPLMGPLAPRLRLARARRAGLTLAPDHTQYLIVDEDRKRPYVRWTKGQQKHTNFNIEWNRRIDLAGQVCPSLLGHGTNPLNEPWTRFRPQDCRDTAVTRIWEATGRLEDVALYHGSTPKDLVKLAQHYIQINPMAATRVGRELEQYANQNGISV